MPFSVLAADESRTATIAEARCRANPPDTGSRCAASPRLSTGCRPTAGRFSVQAVMDENDDPEVQRLVETTSSPLCSRRSKLSASRTGSTARSRAPERRALELEDADGEGALVRRTGASRRRPPAPARGPASTGGDRPGAQRLRVAQRPPSSGPHRSSAGGPPQRSGAEDFVGACRAVGAAPGLPRDAGKWRGCRARIRLRQTDGGRAADRRASDPQVDVRPRRRSVDHAGVG